MMPLHPIPSGPNRVRHVLKHYYHLPERFFDLGGDLRTWLAAWNALRIVGAQDESNWYLVLPGSAAETAVDDGHERWFQIAAAAAAWAIAHGEVRPAPGSGICSLLGQKGVVIIARTAGPAYQLLTCYRTVPGWSALPRLDPHPWEDRARRKVEALLEKSGVAQRTAVRRNRRHALIQKEQEQTADASWSQEENP